jgi:tetratricopeptide (TPR) repeat protein
VRVVAFLGLTVLLYWVATLLPGVGPVVASVPILGVLGAAALAGTLGRAYESRILDRRRAAAQQREFGALDRPYAQGKLGAALLDRGRVRAALPYLRLARAGDPENPEVAYRLGLALLARRDPAGAVEALAAATERDEEHAFGAALLRLAEARLAAGDARGSLSDLARVERNHGVTPETAYRRGLALRSLGERAAARAAFAEVERLAASAPRFQRSQARSFRWRAALARWR